MSDEQLREWTVMVYFAADNDLTRDALLNLDQIQKIGSTEQVQIFLQLDPKDPFSPAQRSFVGIGGGINPERSVELESDPNTGSAADLVNFAKWVKDNGGDQAKKFLLVLWGHGDGVDDDEDDDEDPAQEPEPSVGPVLAKRSANGHSLRERATAGTLALERAMTESTTSFGLDVHPAVPALLLDEHPQDSLTSRELKEALKNVKATLGVKQIDLLGFDACLMSMVEVAQQINDSVALMVASEHSIPDKSWPYTAIVKKLTADPQMTPPALARIIVDEYIADNEKSCTEEDCSTEAVTLSACDLSRTPALADQLLALGQALSGNLKKRRLRQAIVKARRTTQSYLISDYVDLFEFCSILKDALGSADFKTACAADPEACKEIGDACQGVMTAIHKQDDDPANFVLYSKINSRKNNPLANSHGVSIYFPLILPLYRNLEMCKTTRWDTFLANYMSSVFLPAPNPVAQSTITRRGHT